MGVGCCNAEAQRRRVDVSFDLPQGWAWVRLRDLGTFTGGHTPSTSNRDLWGDEVLWVTSKDMKSKYINDTILKLTQLGAAELTMLKPNSIIMCTRSGILRRTFPVAIATQHLTINQDQRALTLYIPEMAEYIYDVLKAFESVILAHYKKAGTTVESIIWNRFTEIPIPMPPLPEQRRIIAKIEELFAIADSLGVAVDGLENAAKRLDKKVLDLAIRGKLVPQDPNDEPASELVKRIAASHKSPCKNQSEPIDPPFEIPDSWEWVRLGLLVQVISGVSYSKGDITESGIRILRGGNLNGNAELTFYDDDVFISPNYYDNDNEIQCGDIVIVASTGSSKVIGRPAIATHDMSGVQIGAFLRIVRAHEREFSKWIATLFCSNYYRTHIRKMSKGTNIKNLKAEYITGFAIPLPPLAEQKRIVAKIEELRAVIKSLTT